MGATDLVHPQRESRHRSCREGVLLLVRGGCGCESVATARSRRSYATTREERCYKSSGLGFAGFALSHSWGVAS